MVWEPPQAGPSLWPALSSFCPPGTLLPSHPMCSAKAPLVPCGSSLCASVYAVLLSGQHELLPVLKSPVQVHFLLETFPGDPFLCPPWNSGQMFFRGLATFCCTELLACLSPVSTLRAPYWQGPRSTHPCVPRPSPAPGTQHFSSIYWMDDWMNDSWQNVISCNPGKCLQLFCF